MPIPASTAALTGAPIIFMSTLADSIAYTLPVEIIRWHLTTAATSTWALQITQTTALSGTTFGLPVIGTTTQSAAIGGSTGVLTPAVSHIDYWIHNWLYGLALNVISGGFVEIIRPPQSEEWVRMRPPGF